MSMNFATNVLPSGTRDLGASSTKWDTLYVNKINGETYESKTASSGGTALSLVTTGEKNDWNNKAEKHVLTYDSTTASLTITID